MLIEDKEALDRYMSVNADLDYELVRPELKRADDLFILDPLFGIGGPLYDELISLDTESAAQKKLLDLLRAATSDFAYSTWARMHSVNNSNSGVTVTRNEHSAPVSDAKLEGIIAERKKTAFRFLELALRFLENNADDFETWKNSRAYTIRKELLISSVDEFDRYAYIDRSRITFMKLRHLRELIRPELGDDLYTLVKAEKQKNELKAVHVPVVEFAQTVLANYACGMYKKDKHMLETAEKHQRAMIDFLRKNKAGYPLLPATGTEGRAPFPNDPDSSQFVF